MLYQSLSLGAVGDVSTVPAAQAGGSTKSMYKAGPGGVGLKPQAGGAGLRQARLSTSFGLSA